MTAPLLPRTPCAVHCLASCSRPEARCLAALKRALAKRRANKSALVPSTAGGRSLPLLLFPSCYILYIYKQMCKPANKQTNTQHSQKAIKQTNSTQHESFL